jgi:hypothetical protein
MILTNNIIWVCSILDTFFYQPFRFRNWMAYVKKVYSIKMINLILDYGKFWVGLLALVWNDRIDGMLILSLSYMLFGWSYLNLMHWYGHIGHLIVQGYTGQILGISYPMQRMFPNMLPFRNTQVCSLTGYHI